jgi:PAS domain S-box-containing protein
LLAGELIPPEGIAHNRLGRVLLLPWHPLIVTTIPIGPPELEGILNSTPDAMVIVDADGRIVFSNRQLQSLFGYGREELLGRPVEVLLPERSAAIHERHRAGYARAPSTRRMGAGLSLHGRRKDGSEFPAEVSLSPISMRGGEFVCSAIRDVTAQTAAEQELREARGAAEQANRSKSAFLAAASHDLRQPLQTLRLLNNVLAKTMRPGSRAAEAVAGQAETLDAMADLLDSLLDVSKLEAGAIEPDVADCSVQKIFSRLRAEFARQAEAKGLRFDVDDSDFVVRSDAGLLEQIIQNLLANAIRYTERGAVMLGATPAGGVVRIDVRDTGIGIAANELEAIFAEFYQVTHRRQGRKEGVGLGLAIVRRLVDLLGHSLEVVSEPGRGSCFSVVVPAAGDGGRSIARREPTTESSPSAKGDGGPRTVVIVEDDDAVAAATAMLFQVLGHRVLIGRDSASALDALAAADEPPALLICDYHLGGQESGARAIERIRQALSTAVPAILLSGDTSSRVQEQARSLADCRLLTKPVDPDQLIAAAEALAQPYPVGK